METFFHLSTENTCLVEKSFVVSPVMAKIDTEELLTVAQAAEVRGVSRQAINHLIRQNKLEAVDIAGRRFVRRGDLERFAPDKGGRPKERKEPKAA